MEKTFALHLVKNLWILALIITFGYSAFEKICSYTNSVEYYKTYFSKCFIHRYVRVTLPIVIVWEIIITLTYIGAIFYAEAVFISSLLGISLLIVFLAAQRIAQDYEGARGIILYMIFTMIPLLL